MKTLTTEAEIAADGSVRILTTLPAWVKPGHARVLVLVEDEGQKDGVGTPRTKLTATPEMIALRKAAIEEVRRLDPYREIADPAGWQREIRQDRPLPFRD